MTRRKRYGRYWPRAIIALWLLGNMVHAHAQDSQWETVTTAGLQALAQRQYSAAVRHLQMALAIVESWPSAEPRVLSSIMNLATAYEAQGQYKLAEPLYQRALALQERLYGSEHPQLLDVLDAYIAMQRKMHPGRSLLPWSLTNRLVNRARRIRDREAEANRREFPGWFDERQIFGDGGI
jgi:tetratricopeptide (TPR) repeat protein